MLISVKMNSVGFTTSSWGRITFTTTELGFFVPGALDTKKSALVAAVSPFALREKRCPISASGTASSPRARQAAG